MNEHIMEFTIDSAHSQMFIAGSCNYSSGLFAIDLSTLRVRTLDKQLSSVCGERVLVSSQATLVVIDPDVVLVDAGTGQVKHRLRSNGAAIDGVVNAA